MHDQDWTQLVLKKRLTREENKAKNGIIQKKPHYQNNS